MELCSHYHEEVAYSSDVLCPVCERDGELSEQIIELENTVENLENLIEIYLPIVKLHSPESLI